MNSLFIPPKTAEKLNSDHPKGTRHKAALEISISLIGNGFSPAAVMAQLRDKFPVDVTDKELEDIVSFAVRTRPTPSGGGAAIPQRWTPKSSPPPEAKKRPPAEHTGWWLAGKSIELDAFKKLSRVEINCDKDDALILLLEMLYTGEENLNIVCGYLLDETKNKARPNGPGRILTRDKWVEYIRAKHTPESKAGAWFRPNPCRVVGSGSGGAVTDSDIEKFRFLLIESDVLPLNLQLALFASLKLPLSVVVLSGGLSVHGWLRLDARDSTDYDRKSRQILALLEPFGIDQCNKNPSRLSRLPSATRSIGASGDGLQALLWLDPQAQAMTEQDISALENRLLVPCIEEKPFKKLIEEAIPRYEEMVLNVGKLGVPTGFKAFDRISGGLKKGGYTLIAAGTGVGKTTLALNILNSALKANYGVALFTAEMPREDIVDMMFSLNCRINRNAFNTGEFTENDVNAMTVGAAWMKNLPLWVDDDPAITCKQIRRRVLSLCAENRIGLVVVDYAQLVMPDSPSQQREQEVAQVALALRLLSREASVPVVVLSQVNDEGRLRESRKLGHEASLIMKMERDKPEDLTDPNVTVFIVKGRKVPTTPLKLYLKGEFCLITERSPVSEKDIPPHYSDR